VRDLKRNLRTCGRGIGEPAIERPDAGEVRPIENAGSESEKNDDEQ
jgi:hypothetical protein